MREKDNYPILWPEVCEVRSDPARNRDKPQERKPCPGALRFAVVTGLMAAAWFGVFVAGVALGWSLGAATVAASGTVFFAGGVLDQEGGGESKS